MRRKNKKKTSKAALWGIGLVILAIVAFLGVMAVEARTVMLMRARVRIEDLPEAFVGKTILYTADIDLSTTLPPSMAAKLFERLAALKPDMLVLGGDYTAHSLLEVLNGDTSLDAAALRRRDAFFHYISDFPAPLGKYALAARSDGDALYPLLSECDFTLLNDSRHRITIGDDALWIVGVTGDTENIRKGGKLFRSGECVLAVADSPDCFPILNTTEARNGGHWVDLCLAGATHGGQMRLFNRELLKLNALERQFLYGWTRETGVPMLTTSGVGCEGAMLRLGTRAEVWLITLLDK